MSRLFINAVGRLRGFAIGAAVSVALLPMQAGAQQFSQQQGSAMGLDLVRTAMQIDMQDMFARSVFLHIRSNPGVLDNQNFYVNFLIYLMTKSPGFDCREAFANEFERRDFFTQSFALADQLRQVVNSVAIPPRFEIAFTINTGRYEFADGSLPFETVRGVSVTEGLSGSIQDYKAQSCAGEILRGTQVPTDQFHWSYQVVNERGERAQPSFPFGNGLTIPANDARTLFDQFGRQYYAIVGYHFQAANNGEAKVQIIPADGQLFGLSSDAVVRVRSYAHPTLSRPTYLDITNPLRIAVPEYGIEADLRFQQEGFRAVGSGTREEPGTDITLGGSVPIKGSAAAGASLFVMRLESPRLLQGSRNMQRLQSGAQRYLTLIGSLKANEMTETEAPVSGNAMVLTVEPDGQMNEYYQSAFRGIFTPNLAASVAPDAEGAQTE